MFKHHRLLLRESQRAKGEKEVRVKLIAAKNRTLVRTGKHANQNSCGCSWLSTRRSVHSKKFSSTLWSVQESYAELVDLY